MSIELGLGFSEDDIEVQGEIDFDFFDNPNGVNLNANRVTSKNEKVENSAIATSDSSPSTQSSSKPPVITVSCGDSGKTTPKTSIETVIPSPEDYTGNNCGRPATPVVCFRDRPKSSRVAAIANELDDSSVSSASQSTSDSELTTSLTDDSFDNTDSMTDVSPLPSHCHSPIVAADGNPQEVIDPYSSTYAPDDDGDRTAPSDIYQSESPGSSQSTSSKSQSQALGDGCEGRSVDVNRLMKAMEKLELDQKKAYARGGTLLSVNSGQRRNMTFSNEEVRRIDQENQRLLKKIVTQQNRVKPHFSAVYSRPSSSSINRQKWQRQIEMDNLALLRRLEATKPSPDLNRVKLLNDYKRHCLTSRMSSRSNSRLSAQLSSSSRSSAQSSGRLTTSSGHTGSRISRDVQHGAMTSGKNRKYVVANGHDTLK